MMECDRYYCRICRRWFPAAEVRDYMHRVLVVLRAGEPDRHVVLPEPEALAFLRQPGGRSRE